MAFDLAPIGPGVKGSIAVCIQEDMAYGLPRLPNKRLDRSRASEFLRFRHYSARGPVNLGVRHL
jgi:hypothetical protein